MPLLTSSSGQVEGGVRHYSLSSEDGELAVQTLDGPGDTVGGRRPGNGGPTLNTVSALFKAPLKNKVALGEAPSLSEKFHRGLKGTLFGEVFCLQIC